MEIKIDAAQIDELAREALVKSAFGRTIQEAITKTLSGSYNSPIDEALKRYITQVASDLITTTYKDQIHEVVAAAVQKKLTKEIIDRFTEVAFERLERALQNY